MSQILALLFPASRATSLAAFFCVCIILGLFTFDIIRILSSIGVAGLTITALLYAIVHRRIEQRGQWRLFLPFTGAFAIHVLAGLNTSSSNQALFWQDVVLQLPFLLLPVAFYLLPSLPTKRLYQLYGIFFISVVLSALGSTTYYILHATEINESYFRSKVMPTLPDHIRFSLMIVLAIAIGILFDVYNVIKRRILIWLLRVSISFLLLYLFMLAVRSGLMVFYLLSLLCIGWKFKRKEYKAIIGITLILISMPLLSFHLLPTFRNKFHNTRDDASRIEQSKSANNYSIVGRVYSYKVAAIIIEQNPWVGIGKADMPDELARQYKKNFPAIGSRAYLAPHNQFLYYLVAFGILGCLAFVISFYYPGIQVWGRQAPIVCVQYVIVTFSFLVEYTLEAQVGILFTLFFLLLALNGMLITNEKHERWRPA